MPTYTDVFSGRSQYSLVYAVTPGTQEVANNRTLVSWSLRINETSEWGSYGYGSYPWSASVSGTVGSGNLAGYDFRSTDSIVLGSGSKWITHNSDGTKTISVSASFSGGSTVIGSAAIGSTNLALTTIPRASQPTMSASSVDAGQSITILTHRASSAFTHTITYSVGGATGTIATKTTLADVAWTPPLTLINNITNATSATCTITVETFSGTSSLGKKTTTFSLKVPASIVPDFTSITHSEATAGVAANIGAYVQGISKLTLGITGAVGAYGSTIKSYEITVGGQSVTSASGTTPQPIDASGTVTITGKVTDSRNRTVTKTVNITVLAYAPPKFNATPSVQRSLSSGIANDEGTYLRVNINAAVQSLIVSSAQKNALRYRVSVKVKGAAGLPVEKVNTLTTGITFNSYVNIGTYSITDAYEVLVEVIDDFTTSAYLVQVPVAKVFMHWDASIGVGIGKYRENGALDVAGDIHSTGTYKNGRNLLSLQQVVYFTSSGTFTKATYPWLQAVRVRLVGGGGGGGGVPATGANVHSTGSGGGGGGYAEAFIMASALAASETVTVGAGGTTTTGLGNNGGDSYFGTKCRATGGKGGDTYANNGLWVIGAVGQGGVGTIGDLLIPGSAGSPGGGSSTLGSGGGGGGSVLGAGSSPSFTPSGGGSANGSDGLIYGGGGGGSAGNANSASKIGGWGASGIVIVELYA